MNESKSDAGYNPAIDNSRDEKQSYDYYKTNEKLKNKQKGNVPPTNEFKEEMRQKSDYIVASKCKESESPSTLKSQDQTYIAQLPENLRLK